MASKVLAKACVQVEDFIGGIVELGDRLGPFVWQFDRGTKLEADDFAAFLGLLTKQAGGRSLRHVLDVPAPDLVDPRHRALARTHGMATVFPGSPEHPAFDCVTAEYAYPRMCRARAYVETR